MLLISRSREAAASSSCLTLLQQLVHPSNASLSWLMSISDRLPNYICQHLYLPWVATLMTVMGQL